MLKFVKNIEIYSFILSIILLQSIYYQYFTTLYKISGVKSGAFLMRFELKTLYLYRKDN
jgi:hypothetical protein